MPPFLQKYTPSDCVAVLLNPPTKIQRATGRFVEKMANGGMTPFDDEADTTGIDVPDKREEIARFVHTHTPPGPLVRAYQVAALKGVPGVARKSAKGKKTRCDYFNEATQEFPYLFRRTSNSDNYLKLAVDLIKFDWSMNKYGANQFGTSPSGESSGV